VVREPDPRDGRVALVRATPRGVQFREEGRVRRTAVVTRQLIDLPVADLASLERATDILGRPTEAR
jgi:hypothetical protein